MLTKKIKLLYWKMHTVVARDAKFVKRFFPSSSVRLKMQTTIFALPAEFERRDS